jgi:hypothetical protein
LAKPAESTVEIMRSRQLHVLAILCCILLAWFVETRAAENLKQCAAMRNDLASKKQQLMDHIDAMKKLQEQNDFSIMPILNHKMGELIQEVIRIEDAVRTCPDSLPSEPSSGLGSVKSESGEYATKSCEELRTLLLQMVQKTTALKRREGSFFSPLSPGERMELQDAEQAFKEVRSAISARCTGEESGSSRGRRVPERPRGNPGR